ncbi:MAG TPA: hypothetical protein ENJ60_11205 [Aeromonadales bacterium]|nr:hypothetical protein [Aeromonadales bacterium]
MFYEKNVKKYVTYPLFFLGLGIAFSAHVQALSTKNIEAIKKDIQVISKLVESSTELGSNRSHPRVKGYYLAEQGIVLNIKFPGTSLHRLRTFTVEDSDFTVGPDPVEINEIVFEALEQAQENWPEGVAPMPPMPPMPEVAYSGSFSDMSSKEMKEYRKAQKALHKKQRALAKQARKIAEKARKLAKDKRDKQLSSERKALAKSQAELRVQQKALRTKLKNIRLKQRQKQQKNYNEWKNNVLTTFCEYAPYPKNLPKREHLSFIFNHASYIDNKKADTIVVLSNSQLKDCRSGKINGTQLLKSAQQYDY